MRLFVALALVLGGVTTGAGGLYLSLPITLGTVALCALGEWLRGETNSTLRALVIIAAIGFQTAVSGAVSNPSFGPHVGKILVALLGAVFLGRYLNWRAVRSIAQFFPVLFVVIAAGVLISGSGYYYGNSARFGIPMFGSPNTTAFVAALSTALTLYSLARARRQANQVAIFGGALLLLAHLGIVALTESDGGMLMISLVIAANLRRRLHPSLLAVAAVGLLAILALHDLDADNADLIGSGRLLIWLDLYTQWIASPAAMLLGFGPGAIDLEPAFTEKVVSAHSMYVETLFTFGLVGFGLLSGYLAFMGRSIARGLPSLPDAEGHLIVAVFSMVVVGIAFDSYFLAAQLVWMAALVHGLFGLPSRVLAPSRMAPRFVEARA